MKKQKLFIIVGPTGAGKSAFAIEFAKKVGGEIISADSRQVYRGLNIGTGKLSKREMHGVPHHLIDIASPKKKFSARDFVDCAQKAIENIVSRKKVPIIAGGTGFYIDALVGRIILPQVAPDEKLRARLEKKTCEQLFAMLTRRDKNRAQTLDPHNKRRLIRALEITSSQQGRSLLKPAQTRTVLAGEAYDCFWIGLEPPIQALRVAIKRRVASWLRRGLIDEVRRLHRSGVSWKRIEELGFDYALVAEHLRGALTKDELVQRLESANWRYGRKQMGYWKHNKYMQWFAPSKKAAIKRAALMWLKT